MTSTALVAGRGLARWWVYQRERFPLVAHAPLIAAFSSAAVCLSALLRGEHHPRGASLLVDRLLERGFTRVTVADVSAAALQVAKARLGPAAARVAWLVADARQLPLAGPVDLWHDRAVFHFLVTPADQDAYLSGLRPSSRNDRACQSSAAASAGRPPRR